MYKSSDFPDRRKQRGARLAATSVLALLAGAALLLQLLPGAVAGITSSDDDPVVSRAPPPSALPNRKSSSGFRLRCWQDGRLLFDEGPVTLGPEARQSASLVAIDRNGGALIVTDAGGTTCLARPFPPPPSLAFPR
jgi:hypothetical protein